MSVVVEIYCNYFVGVEIEMLQVFKMIDVNCVDFIFLQYENYQLWRCCHGWTLPDVVVAKIEFS